MRLLYLIINIYFAYQDKQYGLIIQKFKKYKKIFNNNSCSIYQHNDKKELDTKLKKIFSVINNKEPIKMWLQILEKESMIEADYLSYIYSNKEYQEVLEISGQEVLEIANYLKNPKISTQHGVKGESHKNVVFVADDYSSNPTVNMYEFFEMWSKKNINIQKDQFENLYYSFQNELIKLQDLLGQNVTQLNANSFNTQKQILIKSANDFQEKFGENPIFNYLYSKSLNTFIQTPNVTNAKAFFKENSLYGTLSAYKLFYVGCSRARDKLTVLLSRDKINTKTLKDQLTKFKNLGFTVVDENNSTLMR